MENKILLTIQTCRKNFSIKSLFTDVCPHGIIHLEKQKKMWTTKNANALQDFKNSSPASTNTEISWARPTFSRAPHPSSLLVIAVGFFAPDWDISPSIVPFVSAPVYHISPSQSITYLIWKLLITVLNYAQVLREKNNIRNHWESDSLQMCKRTCLQGSNWWNCGHICTGAPGRRRRKPCFLNDTPALSAVSGRCDSVCGRHTP